MKEMIYLLNSPLANGMMRSGPGPGFWLGGLMDVLWTVLIVLLVLWIVRNWSGISAKLRQTTTSIQPSGGTASPGQTPLEIVQTRYARGEIDRETYETMRRDLSGEAPPAPA